ncbi:MAG: hypothetical protein C0592_09655 [Marinilabiliales bacterium]|nr:MAG: hypothetical protein C0592_09655 [Marinilabiliales bacterium]
MILNAQTYEVDELSQKSPSNSEEIYSFPILKGGDEEICEKINKYLIEDHLYINYGTEQNSIFENVWGNDEDPAMIYSLAFEVDLINERMYSVTLSGEYCGAYCEGYETTYTFDLETGDIITLNMLFTEEGLEGIVEEMEKNKKEKIEAKLEEVHAMLASDTLADEMRDYYTEMVDMYENCECVASIEYLEYQRFIPADDYLIVVYGRCSAHYNMAMDELWYFELELPFEQWSGLFSDYAKELF